MLEVQFLQWPPCERSSIGRALAFQAKGCEFETRRSLALHGTSLYVAKGISSSCNETNSTSYSRAYSSVG